MGRRFFFGYRMPRAEGVDPRASHGIGYRNVSSTGKPSATD